jgi:hypothetical protein
MKRSLVFIVITFILICAIYPNTHTLYTVDGTKYEGKLVAFKYGLLHFNIYKFNKYKSLRKFPISQVWKIEFNTQKEVGITSSFETESLYARLRRGKRVKRVKLNGNEKWLNTGINLKIGQDILFSITGAIYINSKKKVYQNGELNVKWNKSKQLPVQPTGAVIAKIGKDGKPFYVGNNKTPIKTKDKGSLFIGINDFNFNDNKGDFIVKIYY